MQICPQCNYGASDSDRFCPSCGSYLKWNEADAESLSAGSDPNQPLVNAAPTEKQHEGPELHAPAQHERYALSLTLSSERLNVEPGATVRLEARVRNLGLLVNEVAVIISGEAAAWTQAEPRRLAVYPGATEVVNLTVAPPADAKTPAGLVPFSVIARSELHPATFAEQRGEVDLGRVTAMSLSAVPERQRARRSADYRILLDSRSNHPISARLRLSRSQPLLTATFTPPVLTVQPNTTAEALLRLQGPEKNPDASHPYPFSVQAHRDVSGSGGDTDASTEAVFLHEPARPPGFLAATVMGWLVGGLLATTVLIAVAGIMFLVVSALSAGDDQSLDDNEINNVDQISTGTNPSLLNIDEIASLAFPASLVLGAVFCVGSTAGVIRSLQSRTALRVGVTGALTGLLTVLWLGGLLVTVLSPSVFAIALLVIANPALLARLLAMLWLGGQSPVHAPLPASNEGASSPSRESSLDRPAQGRESSKRGGMSEVRGWFSNRSNIIRKSFMPTFGRPERRNQVSTGHGVMATVKDLLFRRSLRTALIWAGIVIVIFWFLGTPGRATTGVNIRADANSGRASIGSLSRGDLVSVRCVDGNWVAITVPRIGYVAKRYVDHIPTRPCLW